MGFSIRKKMVMGISLVAIITYGVSGFFIFYLNDMLTNMLGLNETFYVIGVLLLGIIWCGILGFIGAGVIVKPLKELEKGASKVAQGEIDQYINVPKSNDEIKALALAYNNMIDNLKKMVQDIHGNFQETNGQVIDMKRACNDAASQADGINNTIEQIASGAEKSATSIQNTAASMEEVTKIASQVQENAMNSSKLSKEMVTRLTESNDVVQSLVSGIRNLAEDNEASLSSVNRLESHAKKVGEIISLVGDIAEQTNLLALNASIEAARAGEEGRGFAVVADEVRKLADESGKAVQGISSLIHNIQVEVSNVVSQISEQVKSANAESEKGAKTTEAIGEMSESVSEVASSIEEILQLVDRQVKTIKSVNEDAQEVAAIAEETSAGAIEVSSVTEEQTAVMQQVVISADILLEHADKLKSTIGQFKVGK